MGRTLLIHLTNASPGLVHEFRNFGEDVYCELRDDFGVSIEEIDRSIAEFHLRDIPRRQVRTVTARISKLQEQYPNLKIFVDEIQEDHDS